MRESDLTVVKRVISFRKRSRNIGKAVFSCSFDRRSPGDEVKGGIDGIIALQRHYGRKQEKTQTK